MGFFPNAGSCLRHDPALKYFVVMSTKKEVKRMSIDEKAKVVAFARLIGNFDGVSDQEIIDRYEAAFLQAKKALERAPVKIEKATVFNSPF